MSFLSSKSAPGLQGANDIPAPMSDADRNAAPADTHKRIVDFVKEAPAARYTFDSHATPDGPQAHVAELCRLRPDGGMSCIKMAAQGTELFKSMQSLGFFCALPAEPSRTHMECTPIPQG